MSRARGTIGWLPRSLHPLAWWLWALGLTVAASRTTNPVLLGAVLGVVVWVVLARRSDEPWANAFRLYVLGGLVIVVIRVVFRVVFGGDQGQTVLLPLPTIPLPSIAAVHLFGNVTAESLLGGFYDALRLATMLICLGAANALANPRRLLRSLPPALHEVSTAVVVALSVFPQLAESVVRVRRARRLRAGSDGSGIKAMRLVVIPVLEDALDRSLLLAASMDSRGYGRTGDRTRRMIWLTGGLLVTGLAGICVGVYALLDGTTPRILASPMLVCAVILGSLGIGLSGRGVRRSSYRPDRWGTAELVVVASGVVAGVVVYLTSRVDPANLNPSLYPLQWPQVSWLPMVGILAGLVPAFATPPPAGSGSVERPLEVGA
ncbi:MAG: energy-coupling factor transport system permease protein [Nocardioidaceae bacterium]|jgi:energy-coupling factor transport system permease protein|nr:energy-coupling factor transport system permease protein [Nocardioidaceae bacterium]